MKALIDITTMTDDACADDNGVGRFVYMMQKKLEEKRAEGRRGWNRPHGPGQWDGCAIEHLQELQREALAKGNQVAVANYAMMIWNRQHPTG